VALARGLRTRSVTRSVTAEPVASFGEWADALWRQCRGGYGFVARRDAAMLNRVYPPDFPGLTRIRVRREGRDIGWLCVTLSGSAAGPPSPEFGSLRVGMIADALAEPDDAATLLALATRWLTRAGADLVITNQIHPAWRAPLRGLGFLRGPSNFVFAYSKGMENRLEEHAVGEDLFLNRGDCDGPPRW
jgi:hypothetical protein